MPRVTGRGALPATWRLAQEGGGPAAGAGLAADELSVDVVVKIQPLLDDGQPRVKDVIVEHAPDRDAAVLP